MGHPWGLLLKKVEVSGFIVVMDVYRSDGNQSGNQALHSCDILGREVGFPGPVVLSGLYARLCHAYLVINCCSSLVLLMLDLVTYFL